jgi:hypothetical protein
MTSTSKQKAWKKDMGKLKSGNLKVSNLNVEGEGSKWDMKVSQHWTLDPNLKSKVVA